MVLYNGMASTSSWAALYFVALMTFGNYVLFNLLVAILVEGFQAEVRDLSRGREKMQTMCRQDCMDQFTPVDPTMQTALNLTLSSADKLGWACGAHLSLSLHIRPAGLGMRLDEQYFG